MDDWKQTAEDVWRTFRTLPDSTRWMILALLLFMASVVWFVAS